MLLPKRTRGKLLDENVRRREGGGISDHLVEAQLKDVGGLWSAVRMEGVRNVLKVSEPNKNVK